MRIGFDACLDDGWQRTYESRKCLEQKKAMYFSRSVLSQFSILSLGSPPKINLDISSVSEML